MNEKTSVLYQLVRKNLEEEKIYKNPNYKLEDLAKELKVNRTKLSNTINKEFGMSFNSLLAQCKVKEAKTLLRNKKTNETYNLEYIGQLSGFNSTSTFFRVFKNITGQTPAEYRNSTKKPE